MLNVFSSLPYNPNSYLEIEVIISNVSSDIPYTPKSYREIVTRNSARSIIRSKQIWHQSLWNLSWGDEFEVDMYGLLWLLNCSCGRSLCDTRDLESVSSMCSVNSSYLLGMGIYPPPPPHMCLQNTESRIHTEACVYETNVWMALQWQRRRWARLRL